MNEDNKKGFYYNIFYRDIGLTTYHAIPYDLKIDLHGSNVSPLWFSEENEFRKNIDWIIQETYTKQKASLKLQVIHGEGSEFVRLVAKDTENRHYSSATEEVVSERVISLSVEDFGISSRKAKRSIQLLQMNNHSLSNYNPKSTDWLRWAEDSEIMAERAGYFASWELSTTNEKYTDAYVVISWCRRKMQSIACCKSVEQKVNDALKMMAPESLMQITIPTYDYGFLESSLNDFLTGSISLETFSKSAIG